MYHAESIYKRIPPLLVSAILLMLAVFACHNTPSVLKPTNIYNRKDTLSLAKKAIIVGETTKDEALQILGNPSREVGILGWEKVVQELRHLMAVWEYEYVLADKHGKPTGESLYVRFDIGDRVLWWHLEQTSVNLIQR